LVARRLYRHRVASRLIETEGGSEFWTDEGGTPFVVRIADIETLSDALREFKVEPLYRFSTSFVGVEQMPAGWIRNAAICLNQAACVLRIPPSVCKGNAVIAQKRS
jgi:hypothetical protein